MRDFLRQVVIVVLIAAAVALMLALCWTVASPTDDRAIPTDVRTVLFLMAVPCQVAFVILRIDNIHSTGTAAMISTVIIIELGILWALRWMRRIGKKKERAEGVHL